MPNDTDLIVKKLEQIEQRLNKLEGAKAFVGLPTEREIKAIAETPRYEEISFPVGYLISLIIGGLILLNTLPRFLSRSLFGTYQNSYGYSSSYDFGSFLFMGLGFLLVGLGVYGISKYRTQKASGVTRRKVETFQPTQLQEIKNNTTDAPAEKPKSKQEDSIEYQIASHWFSIVGIIAILLGVVFFLKLAFDNDWIGPAGQVSIGIIFGMVLLAAGEALRAKYAKYSQIITGGGLGVLYLSVWAAYGIFQLIDANILLFGMSLITVCGALLAVRYNALAIAVIAVLGGFITPLVLSGGIENQLLLLYYVVILNLGVLFVAFFKNWRPLNILSFISTYFVYLTWYGNHYDPTKLLTTFIFLTILFLIFSFVWVVYNLIYEKKVEEQDILLMVLNAVVYFGFSYGILSSNYSDYLGFFALALSVYYFIFGYIAYTKFKAESALTLGLLGISIIFLTVAVPLQVKQNLITLIWTAEAAVILWLGFWLSSYKLRVAALAIYILVVIRLFLFDAIIPLDQFQLLINKRFITYFAAAVSAGIASWFYWKNKGKTQEEESVILPALLIGLNVILVVALTLESYSYFGVKISDLNKKLYKTEAPTAVLGQTTVSKTIASGAYDSTLGGCGTSLETSLRVGIDSTCASANYSRLVFTNMGIPIGATVTSSYLYLYPKVSVLGSAYFTLKLSDSAQNVLESVNPMVWLVGKWTAGQPVISPNLASQINRIITQSSWQDNGVVAISVETTENSLWEITSFEGSSQQAARLMITYSMPDFGGSGGVSNSPYIQEPQDNSYNNNYQNNYRATPTPYKYQNNYKYNAPDPAVQAQIKDLTVARNFSMSIIWLLYSLTLIVIGIVNKYKPIRLSALAFFAITILKIFLVDSSSLDKILRIVAFIGLGTVLLVVAFIYQKYKEKINALLL